MAKGEVYRLVEGATGQRVLCVSNELWPALTGIVTDNEFQFEPECYQSILKEIVNMPLCNFVTEYTDRVAAAVYRVADAGENVLSFATVAFNEVQVVQNIALSNYTRPGTRWTIWAGLTITAVPLKVETSPATAVWSVWSGEVILKEGDYIYVLFQGCSAGDVLHARYSGYKYAV